MSFWKRPEHLRVDVQLDAQVSAWGRQARARNKEGVERAMDLSWLTNGADDKLVVATGDDAAASPAREAWRRLCRGASVPKTGGFPDTDAPPALSSLRNRPGFR